MRKKEMFGVVDNACAVIEKQELIDPAFVKLKMLRDALAPKRGALVFLKVELKGVHQMWDGPMKSIAAKTKAEWWERSGYTAVRQNSTPELEREVQAQFKAWLAKTSSKNAPTGAAAVATQREAELPPVVGRKKVARKRIGS